MSIHLLEKWKTFVSGSTLEEKVKTMKCIGSHYGTSQVYGVRCLASQLHSPRGRQCAIASCGSGGIWGRMDDSCFGRDALDTG